MEHSKLKKSPFELHYGIKPRSEINKFFGVNQDENLKKISCKNIATKPETIPIYTFSADGGITDQLIMKAQRKQTKPVSDIFAFYFLGRNHRRRKFESMHINKPQKVVSGTEYKVTADEGRQLHRKLISIPLKFQDRPTLRGLNPRDAGGKWRKKDAFSAREGREYTEALQHEEIEMTADTQGPSTSTNGAEEEPVRCGIGRGYRKKLVRSRSPVQELTTANDQSVDDNILSETQLMDAVET